MKLFLFFTVVIALSSCGSDYGHRVSGDNLTVYFNNPEDQELAERIAHYWKQKDLIGTAKQDLQLVREKDVYQLRIIANEPMSVTQMPFRERKLLLGLQKEIQDSLSKSTLELVICNSKFEPVYNINE